MFSRFESQLRRLNPWLSKEQWEERIVTFEASWFTLTMGTGILVQNLNFFPYSAQWLQDLSYVFWVLDISLFALFVVMGLLRLAMFPKVVANIFNDFQQTSYLGAIPVSLNTVTAGLIIHYSDRYAARYAAEALFWIGVSLTLLVGFGGIFAMYRRQGQHTLEEVTGVWLLTFIPMIVTAALGSTLTPYLLGNNATTILVVSFLLLSLGLGLSLMVIGIYLWRLMACSLPPRDAIVSCFVPIGPLGMGAFAILGLSKDLAGFIATTKFSFQDTNSKAVDASGIAAIVQIIQWLGVISCLALLGFATFFLVEAFASVFSKLPKTFNIGFWSFVFPCGVYGNAFCRLSTTLMNDGLKGWAATCVVSTILLWVMCVVMTLYKAVWCGKLFIAPGLQGFVEQRQLNNMKTKAHEFPEGSSDNGFSSSGEHQGASILTRRYVISIDGTCERMHNDQLQSV